MPYTTDTEGRWIARTRWWWSVREAFGGWHQVPPKMLPAFYAHPASDHLTSAMALDIDVTPAPSLPEALAIQEVYRKMGNTEAEPVWYTIPRVLADRDELLGSLHRERKACGKEACKCESGREEDLHGPYTYRRWRDEGGDAHKTYVPSEDVAGVETSVERRKRRVEEMRELRSAYLETCRARAFQSYGQKIGGKRHDLSGHVERWTQAHEKRILGICPWLNEP